MSPDQKSRLIDLVGDQYDVGEVIGKGGQATVYRAVHLRLNREVALKVLREDALDHSGHLARFTREIRILSVLQHPNIVRIYDSCPDHPWFPTELIQGFDIVEYCDLHGLDARGRVELFAKVAGAIGAAHLLAITHRDLKPSNILVDLDAEPHVVDFGLACDASE
ncbi:MAG: serine/threonine-protein kinase, partial [Planctomycetota bacterium]|nr:serine/threonine-protein kinase [Planctomycetota bacterium]